MEKNIVNISFDDVVNKTMYELVDIDSVEITHHNNMVDLTIEDDETFVLANGILSHNSARGFMLNVRESNKLGMFSLQGKIDNVSKISSAKELMDIKVLRELMISTGLKVNQPPKEMNYGKLILATDADVDGSAISMLLINFFSLWGEEIFDKIYRVLPPLYSSHKKGSVTKYYYSQEEFSQNESNLRGHEIIFYKGLGSLDESAFGDMINNPRLIKIQWDSEATKYLSMLFDKNNENKRKDWLLTGTFE